MRSQTAQIIDYLATGKSLNPMEALRRFNCWRLGGRIHELRRHHDIRTTMVKVGKKLVAEYRLVRK